MEENSAYVYDLVFPSPSALQELAAVVVAAKLWRELVSEHRSNNTLNTFKMKLDISQDTSRIRLLPHLPKTIRLIIEKYVENIQASLVGGGERQGPWLLSVLSKIDDIVCDVDGGIDYYLTARRALLSEAISDIEKFEIACKYCLEDDIMRIWPSVSDSEHLDLGDNVSSDLQNNNYCEEFLFRYWVCRLRNQLHKIPPILDYNHDPDTFEHHLREISITGNWPCVIYFWNSLNAESRMRSAESFFQHETFVFCRYILAKLSEEELNTLVSEARTYSFIDTLMCNTRTTLYNERFSDEEFGTRYFLAAWSYITRKITECNFIVQIWKLFKYDGYTYVPNKKSLYYELWNSIPDHLKQMAIRDCLLDRSLFETKYSGSEFLLLAALKDTPFDARNTLWRENWRVLLSRRTIPNFKQCMNLCFENESNVNVLVFKENNLSKYENIKDKCSEIIKKSHWSELDEFLNLCSLENQTYVALRVKYLDKHLEFFHSEYIYEGRFDRFIDNFHSLDKFINDTYQEVGLAADFKNRLLLAPKMIEVLARYVIWNKDLDKIMEFVDAFVITEQAAVDFKQFHFLPGVLHLLTTTEYCFQFEREPFEKFMRWCLGSDEKIAKFKSTVPLNEIAENIRSQEYEIEDDCDSDDSFDERAREDLYFLEMAYCELGKFLEWCLSSPEEVSEFKSKFDGFRKYASE
ncbi:uncharacterized protein LOC135832953 [Planococcus citri]|uniref:uncharacterized protein LOC135832953 n=1 Tax=Planococcus citri TaxID=170843 RepID=UPI0031F9537B